LKNDDFRLLSHFRHKSTELSVEHRHGAGERETFHQAVALTGPAQTRSVATAILARRRARIAGTLSLPRHLRNAAADAAPHLKSAFPTAEAQKPSMAVSGRIDIHGRRDSG
jgi:hypothetical protein